MLWFPWGLNSMQMSLPFDGLSASWPKCFIDYIFHPASGTYCYHSHNMSKLFKCNLQSEISNEFCELQPLFNKRGKERVKQNWIYKQNRVWQDDKGTCHETPVKKALLSIHRLSRDNITLFEFFKHFFTSPKGHL